ncbi:MAG: PrsW family intramembrane metalloprotease [Pseudomonadota bacterium]
MDQWVLILPIVVPVIFWAIYHYYKDHHLPEPIGHLVLAFILGALATTVSQVFYEGLGVLGLRFDAGYLADTNTVKLFFYAVLAIGPIEEFAKLLMFWFVILKLEEFDEPLDGIIYASFIGLGYAAVENWQYLEFLTVNEAIARGFAGPVIHILFASIWGYYVGRAKLAGKPLWPSLLVAGSVAALTHGLYDFAVLQKPYAALPCAAVLIAGIWLWRLKLMRDLHIEATQSRDVT